MHHVGKIGRRSCSSFRGEMDKDRKAEKARRQEGNRQAVQYEREGQPILFAGHGEWERNRLV
jgi:hypothetical protein